MLTMHADSDVMARAIQAGAAGYLVKDCSTEEVVAAVRMAERRRRRCPSELAAPCSPRSGSTRTVESRPLISNREEEVLQLVADGCSLPEVAPSSTSA